MAQAAGTIAKSISVGQVRKGAVWKEIGDEAEQSSQVIAAIAREWRE